MIKNSWSKVDGDLLLLRGSWIKTKLAHRAICTHSKAQTLFTYCLRTRGTIKRSGVISQTSSCGVEIQSAESLLSPDKGLVTRAAHCCPQIWRTRAVIDPRREKEGTGLGRFLWSTGNDSLNRFDGGRVIAVAVGLGSSWQAAPIISPANGNPFRMQPISSVYACGLRAQYA